MFDKYNLTLPADQVRPIQQHSIFSITENRAPTDESMRLLQEMEEKVISKILGSFKLKSTTVSGQIVFFATIDSLNTKYRIRYKLNDKEFQFDGFIDDYRMVLKDHKEIIQLFVKSISEEIATMLFEENIEVIANLFKRGF
jgi:cell fate (sporulation/competence/biofilm development) regulator YmcA (YheA/YmcA/DUF963 family)